MSDKCPCRTNVRLPKISALKIANNSLNFTSILAKIINKSFNEGVFPQQLKTARVVPIFKEGSKTDVGNYRPISLLSSISKIFEKLMYNRIMEFLSFNGILHEMQYGFRQGRSCEHALLKAKQVLLDSLSMRQVSLLLLIDYAIWRSTREYFGTFTLHNLYKRHSKCFTNR